MKSTIANPRIGCGAEDICERFRACAGLDFILIIWDAYGWLGAHFEYVGAVALAQELCGGASGSVHALAALRARFASEAGQDRDAMARTVGHPVTELRAPNVDFVLALRDPL